MKRPSGFDRSPERRPEAEPAPAPEEGGEAARPGLGRVGDGAATHLSSATADALRRAVTLRRPVRRPAEESAGADPDPDPATAESMTAGSAPARTAAEEPAAAPSVAPDAAETVDLSEVREAKAAGRALSLRRGERDEDPVRAAEKRLKAAGRQRRARIRSERKRFSADSRRRRRVWLIAGGAVLGLALFVLAGVFTPLMAVRDIQVEGTQAMNPDDVTGALARFDGVPLALVDDAEVHQALEPFPLVQRYAVERVPPSTLIVRIEERVPVMSIKEGEIFSVYDAAGVLLSSADAPAEGVPVGTGALADRSGVPFRTAARALRDMPAELRAQVAAVSASSGQDVTFALTSGVEVIWGDAERSAYKALVLQRMLASLAAQERPVSQVDVSSPGAPVFQ
ncbi:FtsQ-type POTRA domain-containing protein [Leucobacter luti]|uniref:FtsQ-type POTRA domain-containing protein n=1 Tax=Leucobacter luti TaxID=340320 RepID=UPI003D0332F9